MVKRRVNTGMNLADLGKLDLGVEQSPLAENDTGAFDLSTDSHDRATGGMAADDIGMNESDMIQHYFDIGKLVASGESLDGVPKGPLDDDIERAMGFGAEGPLGKDIAGITGFGEEGPLSDEIGKSMGFGAEGPLRKDIDTAMGYGAEGPLGKDIEKTMGFGTEGPLGKGIIKQKDRELAGGEEGLAGIAGLDGGMERKSMEDYAMEPPVDASGPVGEGVPIDFPRKPDGSFDFTGIPTPKPVDRVKGEGFFGRIPTPGGSPYDYSTELAITAGWNGQEYEIPTLVPTLTNQEIDHMVSGGELTDEIFEKAVRHAQKRMAEGKFLFAQEGEQQPRPIDSPEEQEAAAMQPVYGAADEGLQDPGIRRAIELDSGIVLDQATEQQVRDYEALVTNHAVEDAATAKRIEGLREKMDTKGLSKLDMILLGAALLMPTLLAAKVGGVEGAATAAAGGIGGGIDVFKLGQKQRGEYGKELTDLQKQQVEAQEKRGKVTEDFLQTIPGYEVQKELFGNETYTDAGGVTGVGLGAPNIFFDKDLIRDPEDIKAMRKEIPDIKKQTKLTLDTDRVTDELTDTVRAIQRVTGDDPGMWAKIAHKLAPGMMGPKAVIDGVEVSLIQQLRSLKAQFATVTEVSGETRFSAQLIAAIDRMLLDPSSHITETTYNDLLTQIQSVKNNTINKFGTYLQSNGVLIEPVFQGYQIARKRSKYELTDKQYQDRLRGISSEGARELTGRGA